MCHSTQTRRNSLSRKEVCLISTKETLPATDGLLRNYKRTILSCTLESRIRIPGLPAFSLDLEVETSLPGTNTWLTNSRSPKFLNSRSQCSQLKIKLSLMCVSSPLTFPLKTLTLATQRLSTRRNSLSRCRTSKTRTLSLISNYQRMLSRQIKRICSQICSQVR